MTAGHLPTSTPPTLAELLTRIEALEARLDLLDRPAWEGTPDE